MLEALAVGLQGIKYREVLLSSRKESRTLCSVQEVE
jgi:hypothetical protein